MVRSHRLLCCMLVAIVLWPNLVMAQSGIDLIPDDAIGAFVINSLSSFREKGEKFIKESDLHFAKDNRPFTYFDELLGHFKWIDEKGSAAIVIPGLKNLPGENVPQDFKFWDFLGGAL